VWQIENKSVNQASFKLSNPQSYGGLL